MGRIGVFLVLSLFTVGRASADPDFLGLFADPDGQSCRTLLIPGTADTLYVLAILPDYGAGGITAAEFAIEGLPENGDGGVWSIQWATDLTIGNPEYGIALGFQEPQIGSVVELGRIILIPMSDGWVEDDRRAGITHSSSSGYLSIVTHEFETIPVSGSDMGLHCYGPLDCVCLPLGCQSDPGSLIWSAIAPGNHADKSFLLRNESDDSIDVDVVSEHPYFQILSGGGPQTLAHGESAPITLRFAPLEEGVFETVIQTGGDNCLGPVCLGSSASGCNILPDNPIDLGEVAVGDFRYLEALVQNPLGSGQVLYLDIGTESPHLTLHRGSGVRIIHPGEQQTVTLTYHPMNTGSHECLVTLGNLECDDLRILGEGLIEPGSHVLENHIGLYRHPNASGCDAFLPNADWYDISILAVLPDFAELGISEATFRIDNIPYWSGGGYYMEWSPAAQVMYDNSYTGVKLAFDPPITGSFVELGTLRLRQTNDGWFPPNFALTVAPSSPDQLLQIIDGSGVAHDLPGSSFHLNCDLPAGCNCGDFDTAACYLWPLSLSFGTVDIGDSTELEFQVSNEGSGIVEGLIPAACEPFQVVEGAGPFALAADESLTVRVLFVPDNIGQEYCPLELGDLDCGLVEIFGTGDDLPDCLVTPEWLDFGVVELGDFEEGTFIIRNQGGSHLTGVIILPTNPDFSIVAGGGYYSLGHDESRSVRIRYEPQSFAAHEALVSIGNNLCIEAVPLTGHGRSFQAGIDRVSLYADDELTRCDLDLIPGQTDTIQVAAYLPNLSERGASAVELRLFGLPDAGPGGDWRCEWDVDFVSGDPETGLTLEFSAPIFDLHLALGRIILEPNLPDWVEADHRLRILGPDNGAAPLLIDALGMNWTLFHGDLTFNCGEPENCACPEFEAAVCEIDVDDLDFGEVTVGQSSTRDFVITNTGHDLLQGSINISGSVFTLSQGAGDFSLAHDEQHQVSVRFSPTIPSQYYGYVSTGLPDCPGISLHGQGGTESYSWNFIGCFGDLVAATCEADINDPYVPVDVHVMANVPSYSNYGIAAAEFMLDNLPGPNDDDGTVTPHWNTSLVIGDPWNGVALSFSYPLYGDMVYLGRLEFLPINTGWIGSDHEIQVMGSGNHDNPIVVTAWDYQEREVDGEQITINCTHSYYCRCDWEDQPQAVLLNDFEALPRAGAVDLSWELAEGVDVSFRLEAEMEGVLREVAVNEAGAGRYLATDDDDHLAAGAELSYHLRGREGDGAWELLRSETVTVPAIPLETALLSPHPNPFNPTVSLPFTLKEAGRTRLTIYDIAGRQVRNLEDGVLVGGEYVRLWRGRDNRGHAVGSGVYFVRLETSGTAMVRKLVLLR